jgi:hypothetical protein
MVAQQQQVKLATGTVVVGGGSVAETVTAICS